MADVLQQKYREYLERKYNSERRNRLHSEKMLKFKWLNLLQNERIDKDCEYLANYSDHFRRLCEQKRERIDLMLSEIMDNSKTDKHFNKKHCEQLRNCEIYYSERVKEMMNSYGAKIMELHSAFANNQKLIDEEEDKAELKISAIDSTLGELFEERELKKKVLMRGWLDEMKNRTYEEINIENSKYETQISRLRNELVNTEVDYQRKALKYQAQYDMLQRKDAESKDIIIGQNRRLSELSSEITNLKDKLRECHKGHELLCKEMCTIKGDLQSKLKILKSDCIRVRQGLRNDCEFALERLSSCSENIKEQVRIFERLIAKNNKISESTNLKRTSGIKVKLESLRARRSNLEKRNSQLKQSLSEYLSGISIDEKSESINPLLIINRR
ncbi:MAG: Dynein regulatory complex subunit 2 [Marteilia pararefringens]